MINSALAVEQAYAMNGLQGSTNFILPVLTVLFWIAIAVVIYQGYKRGKKKLRTPSPTKVTADMDKKNPGIALLISFFIWGGGQIYNGQIKKGIIFLIYGVITVLLLIGTIESATNPYSHGDDGFGFIVLAIMILIGAISSMADAYISAININKAIDGLKLSTMKKCPFCAELIKDEAIVCRYCGKELEQPT